MSRKTKHNVHEKRKADYARRKALGLIPGEIDAKQICRDKESAQKLGMHPVSGGLILITNPYKTSLKRRQPLIIPGRGSAAYWPEENNAYRS